jgi:2-polyprenyl-6-methoxyphenol hydroxylase-like FAD-dependent oxidoreductase
MITSSAPSIPDRVDVLVAGAGPCGLMLANELGLRGVSCLVVDQKATMASFPQANATQARTMEHFRRIGIAAELRAMGLPGEHPTDIAYFTHFSRHELARLRLPTAAQATEQIKRLSGSWSAAELPHRISQKYVEAVLHRQTKRFAGTTIRFGWRLDGFTQGDDGVRATVVPVGGGDPVIVHARYLVGADGARSRVRAALGISYGGSTGAVRPFMGGKMFAAHLRAPAFYDAMPHDLAWMFVSFNHERRGFMCSVDGQGEFVFHAAVHADEAPEPWTEPDARRLFREVSGMDIPIEVLSTGVWIAGHSLVAERYQQGRVFLAGDAVHLFTPTGGLGYNTAVGDAVNLGWKLASVVKGVSHATLLDSYEAERRPIGLRNTAYAKGFADSVGLLVASEHLEDEGPAGDALRTEAGEQLDAHVRREFNIPGVTFGERYDASPIVDSDPSDIPPDAANSYVPSTNPGGRLPHLWLGGTESLFDKLHFEWTVLAAPEQEAPAHHLAEAGIAAGLSVQVLALDDAPFRDLLAGHLLVVRPDQMVAWRGRSVEDARTVWARVARAGID